VDLLDPIGTLACKVPRSVKLAEVMQKLTGTLGSLTIEQLRKLPELIEATITVQPTALEVRVFVGIFAMCKSLAALMSLLRPPRKCSPQLLRCVHCVCVFCRHVSGFVGNCTHAA
jgi:hypothetical protein